MSFNNAITFDFDNFVATTDATETRVTYYTNPLVLLIALREKLDSHEVIGIMRHLANKLAEVNSDEFCPKILPSHISKANHIMEYYGMKYATYRLTGAKILSSYQKCVMELRTRFQNGDYSITEMEQRALWRLIDFHEVDTKLDTVISECVSAKNLPDGNQELDCTVYTKFSLINRRRANRKADIYLAKTADQQIVMFELPEKDPALPFLNYVFDNHHGFRVGVRRSLVSRLIPSTDFEVLVLRDYDVLKLY
jgi:hypothetical protein